LDQVHHFSSITLHLLNSVIEKQNIWIDISQREKFISASKMFNLVKRIVYLCNVHHHENKGKLESAFFAPIGPNFKFNESSIVVVTKVYVAPNVNDSIEFQIGNVNLELPFRSLAGSEVDPFKSNCTSPNISVSVAILKN